MLATEASPALDPAEVSAWLSGATERLLGHLREKLGYPPQSGVAIQGSDRFATLTRELAEARVETVKVRAWAHEALTRVTDAADRVDRAQRDARALRAALLALVTAAERFLEPAHWTSPVRRGALADATREAWTVLGPPTKGDH
jgi:hypothetical protein